MTPSTTSLHALLLLSDSALPLGSFAFSSGLESFLAHHPNPSNSQKLQSFDKFLQQSILNIASTALPYVLTAYHHPDRLGDLDHAFDASTPCTVARRASITQGKALLTVWERALSGSVAESVEATNAAAALTAFATAIKGSKPDEFGLQLNAHFPALFGTICCALGLSEQDVSYLFLLNHAKTLLSAAVRASVLGPYQSQAILASSKLQHGIREAMEPYTASIDGSLRVPIEDATVTVPTMDLWVGRHELLYSRIFNS